MRVTRQEDNEISGGSEAESNAPMRTVRCTLTFGDGQKVVAQASAQFEKEQVQVEYSGPAERLRPRPNKASLPFLEWYFSGMAMNLGATMDIETEGAFEPG